MFVIGATGAIFMLVAVVMISVVSLICYIKTSHVSAAVMFVSSVLTIVSELVRDFYPLLMRGQSPQTVICYWNSRANANPDLPGWHWLVRVCCGLLAFAAARGTAR